MIVLFIVSLFLTFVTVRVFSHILHDREHYGTRHEKSRTLTRYLRVKTGYDWHHFHIGILLLALALGLMLMMGLRGWMVVILAVGISMTLDQIVPFFYRRSDYFSINNILLAFVLHAVITIFAIVVLR